MSWLGDVNVNDGRCSKLLNGWEVTMNCSTVGALGVEKVFLSAGNTVYFDMN